MEQKYDCGRPQKVRNTMTRVEAINQANKLAVEWEMSFEETIKDLMIEFYECAGFYLEQIEDELAPMNKTELLEAFYNTFCLGNK